MKCDWDDCKAEVPRRPGPPRSHCDEHRIVARLRLTPSGCFEWTGALTGSGYGLVSVEGRDVLVHRFMYELALGVIPEGMHVDHLCRYTACANPDHLQVVTPQINTLRGVGPAAINARLDACRRGHPFDEKNTYHCRGRRVCRACNNMRQKQYEAAKRAR